MIVHRENKTAILVFARSSREEVKHKRMSKGRLLFDTLNGHTLQTVKKTGMPFFHFTEKLQYGVSFGERFSNAVQYVFNQGYDNVITVGNDSPHLDETHIEQAKEALANGKLVFGLSVDGGFYMIGLHSATFKKEAFERLPWQTCELQEETMKLFSSSIEENFLLPQLIDIDSFQDLFTLSKFVSELSPRIRALVLSICCKIERIESFDKTYFDEFHCRIPSNRGSPIYFSH